MKIYSLLMILCLVSCHKAKPITALPPPRVQVITTEAERIPIFIDAVGTCVAFNSVTIKAQVEGYLTEIYYEEGQDVHEDELLVKIDPRVYEQKYLQATAAREENKAQLKYAAEKVSSYEGLIPEKFVAQLTYDQFVSERNRYEAAVARDDATVALAKINYEFCFIKAPFNGVAGKKLIDKGNLIINNGEPLLVINQVDPMYIDFSIPERDYWRAMQGAMKEALDVLIFLPEAPNTPYTADLKLIDNSVRRNTGMIPLRAQIRNKERRFWPGLFIRAKLVLRYEENAVMVPQEAVNIGQKGRYVYVVNSAGKAEYRSVTVGETIEGRLQITEGVKAGEQVIINGQLDVLPGVQVMIVKEKAT